MERNKQEQEVGKAEKEEADFKVRNGLRMTVTSEQRPAGVEGREVKPGRGTRIKYPVLGVGLGCPKKDGNEVVILSKILWVLLQWVKSHPRALRAGVTCPVAIPAGQSGKQGHSLPRREAGCGKA